MRLVPASLSSLPDDEAWAALAAQASEPNPFLEHWFLRPALAHLHAGATVWLAIGESQGRLIGLMPLTIAPHYGRLPIRHVTNWMHYQSFLGTPLVARGWEKFWFAALLSALDRADWAPNFLSLTQCDARGPVFAGLKTAGAECARPVPIVHRRSRALLASSLQPERYLETHIRPKKRKEWRRLHHRLAELGRIEIRALTDEEDLDVWRDKFLQLESAGWKGTQGAALANAAETRAFFQSMMDGARKAGRLECLRMNLDDTAIAMLVNFRTPPASWSFKIAHDPQFGRFSPGVMVELEALARVLTDPDIAWMDSCAAQDHPMINSLWAERRELVQVSVPFAGARRHGLFALCRAAAGLSAHWRRFRRRKPIA